MPNSITSFLKSSVTNLRKWIASKGVAGIAVIAGVSVVVLFAGVGGTVAATGGFPSLVSTPSATPSTPEPSPTSSATSTQAASGEAPSDILAFGNWSEDSKKIGATGWVGAKFTLFPGGYQLVFAGRSTGPDDTKITHQITFNGMGSPGNNYCGTLRAGLTCPGATGGQLTPSNPTFCYAGGDTYSVTVSGMGINFSESGVIPASYIGCPAPAAPAPPAPAAPVVPGASSSPSTRPVVPPGDPSNVLPQTTPTP